MNCIGELGKRDALRLAIRHGAIHAYAAIGGRRLKVFKNPLLKAQSPLYYSSNFRGIPDFSPAGFKAIWLLCPKEWLTPTYFTFKAGISLGLPIFIIKSVLQIGMDLPCRITFLPQPSHDDSLTSANNAMFIGYPLRKIKSGAMKMSIPRNSLAWCWWDI